MRSAAARLANLLNTAGAGAPPPVLEECIVQEAYALLREQGSRSMRRRARDWKQLHEDSDDLEQHAITAFLMAIRTNRLLPPEHGQHTADSVAAYMWGICNNIFLRAVRQSRPGYVALEAHWDVSAGAVDSALEELQLLPADSGDERIWEVLRAVEESCAPKDTVLAFLQCCGFSGSELARLLRTGINVPARALGRVGGALRCLLGLDGSKSEIKGRTGGTRQGRRSRMTGLPEPLSGPLDLLRAGRFAELRDWLNEPQAREQLVLETALAVAGRSAASAGSHLLQERQRASRLAFQGQGDWSWGLLSREERLALLKRDLGLLQGGGTPDGGATQHAAFERMQAQLQDLYSELELGLSDGELDWLLPIAESLLPVLQLAARFTEMQDRYAQLLAGARRLGSPQLELLARVGLAVAHLHLADYPATLQHIDAAEELAERLGDSAALFELNLKRAAVMEKCGDFNASLHWATLALEKTDARDAARRGKAWLIVANAHRGMSDILPSIRAYETALGHFRECGSPLWEAHVQTSIGSAYNHIGRNEDGRERFRLAIATYVQFQAEYPLAIALNNLGSLELDTGNFDLARSCFGKCLESCERSGDQHMLAGTLNNLGSLEMNIGNYQAGLKLIEQALLINQSIGNATWATRNLGVLAYGHRALLHSATAKRLYRQLLTEATDNCDAYDQGTALFGLGALALAGSILDDARESCFRALTVREAIADEQGRRDCLTLLGGIEWRAGQYQAAIGYLLVSIQMGSGLADKATMAENILQAGAALAAAGLFAPAAVIEASARSQLKETGYVIPPDMDEHYALGYGRLDAAVQRREFSAERLELWRAQGEAMSLDELAQFTLQALEEARASLPPDPQDTAG